MADNYLERRMEDYRSGRLGNRSKTRTALPADALVLRYNGFKVLIVGAPGREALLEVLLDEFGKVGAKVAFLLPDRRTGTALAQRFGARFYPGESFDRQEAMAALAGVWGADVKVIALDGGLEGDDIVVGEGCPQSREAARLLLYLMHPSNAALLGSGLFSAFLGVNNVENS